MMKITAHLNQFSFFVQLRPLVDLVRGFPCAVTKRRHLQKALDEYLATFDSCKCTPCPNNALPALSGTECACICQIGTYGPNCEKRARSFTSGSVFIIITLFIWQFTSIIRGVCGIQIFMNGIGMCKGMMAGGCKSNKDVMIHLAHDLLRFTIFRLNVSLIFLTK